MSDNLIKILIVLAYVFFFVIITPLAGIWALNTLFPTLAIPVAFNTWAAAFILIGLFQSAFKKEK